MGADEDGGRLSDFPSGHTAAGVAFVGALAVFALPHTRAAPARWLVVAAALAVSVLLGWGRVAAGAHTTLDVVGGAVLGLGWLAACVLWWPPDTMRPR